MLSVLGRYKEREKRVSMCFGVGVVVEGVFERCGLLEGEEEKTTKFPYSLGG